MQSEQILCMHASQHEAISFVRDKMRVISRLIYLSNTQIASRCFLLLLLVGWGVAVRGGCRLLGRSTVLSSIREPSSLTAAAQSAWRSLMQKRLADIANLLE